MNLERILRLSIFSIGIVYLVFFLIIVILRITYPFELEWLEGNFLESIYKIRETGNIYSAPSIDFMPFPYTPFYYYVSTLFSYVFGINFFALRLVSIISTLGLIIIIFKFIYRETKEYFPALLGVFIFIAMFRTAGAWYDTAHVDMLFTLFLILSIYFIRKPKNLHSYIYAGLLIFLAFITKQLALFVMIPSIIYLLITNRKGGLIFIASSIIPIVIFTLLFNKFSHGWYWYYTYQIIKNHGVELPMILGYWTGDILKSIPVILSISIIFIIQKLKLYKGNKTESNFHDILFWIFYVCTFLALGWGGRLNKGGYSNVLIPTYLSLSIIFSIGTYFLLGNKRIINIVMYIAIIFQFFLFRYNPVAQIPTYADRKGAEYLISTIQDIDGEVFLPFHPYLLRMAGKKPHAHLISIMEVSGKWSKKEVTQNREVLNEIKNKIQNKKYSALILNHVVDWLFPNGNYEEYYVNSGAVFEKMPGRIFFPVTGMETRPMSLHLPRENNK